MIKIDITKKVKYEECEDANGRFILVSYRDKPIAEVRIRPGWKEKILRNVSRYFIVKIIQ